MLEIRPTCENCMCELSADSRDAMICSYECTFCRACVDDILENVCPNCGGTFVPRPVRVETEWKDGVSLSHHPASDQRVHKPVNVPEHKKFAADVKKYTGQD